MQIEVQTMANDLDLPRKRGMLITIEGIDGCGKSTQLQKIATFLQSRQIPYHITCEPTKNDIGQLLRKYLKQKTVPTIDALLFAADRLDHCHREILPALQSNKLVISDRYVLSSIAYQSLQCEELGVTTEWIATINQFCIVPDLIILLDLDPTIALQRRYNETEMQNREKFEEITFQSRLRNRYLQLVEDRFNGWNYAVVDASRNSDDVFASIVKVFVTFLPKS